MQDDNAPWQDPHATPAPAPIADAASQPLDFDLACVRCTYNLRGALPTGACPECGEPVATTLRPDLLHQADVGWLGALRKGSNWLVTAIVMNLVIIPIAMVIGFISAASAIPAQNSNTLPIGATLLLIVLGLAIAATYGVAVWFLTQPDPVKLNSPMTATLARWLIVPGVVIGLPAELFNASSSQSVVLIGAMLNTISGIMVLVGFLAGLLYLRSLAERIPEPSLAKQTTIVFWGYLSTMSVFIVVGIGAAIYAFASAGSASPNVASGAAAAIGLLMCPLVLAMLVFVIWLIVLMFRYRARFTQAHEIALARQSDSYA